MTLETKQYIQLAFEAAKRNEDLSQAAILCSLLASENDPIGERDLLDSTMAATERSIARIKATVNKIISQSN